MKPTADNLRAHELIGLQVIVAASKDPTLRGMQGEVVDETKRMFAILFKGAKKWLPKSICTLSFALSEGKQVSLVGSQICFKPEDRISTLR